MTITSKTWNIKTTRYISLSCASLVLALWLASCQKSPSPVLYPAPTDKTVVNLEMESAKKGLDKAQWIEDIHSAAPGVDWRSIERSYRLEQYRKELKERQQGLLKDNTVNIADGLLVGEWNEKGSNNLSGSMTMTDYDSLNHVLYAISAGGSLWKYTFDTGLWRLLNDDLRFDDRFLKICYPPGGGIQIVSSINGKPYYSDTGLEWQLSSGPQVIYGGRIKNVRSLNGGKDIFYLLDEGAQRNIKLYHSQDYGRSFIQRATFATSDLDNLSIDALDKDSTIYIIEQMSASHSRLLTCSTEDNQVRILNDNTAISFGADGRGNLRVRSAELGAVQLYCYDAQNNYYQSANLGQNWMKLSTLPARPWHDGVFVSYADPQLMILSEVEAHISRNGGITWSKINGWPEYYDDPVYKLHADMMHIDEYKSREGNMICISNHGGINVSYDNSVTNKSIAQYGLNVSQYYSVRTYPADQQYVFAGSQDQGIQRAYDLNEGSLNFTQLFSGDYGHICFTNLGESMWTVYPGGWVFYFDNPVSQNYATTSYQLDSPLESVWLPPLISSPYAFNAVLLAGGNVNGGQGSHVIELKISDFGALQKSQWPFDFSVSGGTVTGMTYNRFFSNVFYVITSNGKFYRSVDSGRNFQDLSHSLNGAHYLYGHEILSSSSDPGVLYIAGSGYSNAPVYKSEDGGLSFRSIQYNLPSTTVFDIAQDPEGQFLFAATEAGAFVYVEHLNSWYDLGQGIAPNQTYWSVEYLHNLNKIRFGTYGRGIWDLDLAFLSSASTIASEEDRIHIYPNPARDYITLDSDLPANSRYTIVNNAGIRVQSGPIDDHIKNIDISSYQNGLFYIIFECGNKKHTKKFLKL